jgi:hypothetical protein
MICDTYRSSCWGRAVLAVARPIELVKALIILDTAAFCLLFRNLLLPKLFDLRYIWLKVFNTASVSSNDLLVG